MGQDATVRPDIARAASRMSATFGGRREIRRLVEHLDKGETVEMVTVGWYRKGSGLVVLTDHRLLFLLYGWDSQQFEDFALGTISSVQWSDNVITGTLAVGTDDGVVEIDQIRRPDGRTLSDRLRERIGTTPVPGELRSA